MSGKAATFGGRMMGSVADQVLKQFAANFAPQVQALQAQARRPARRLLPPAPAAPARSTAWPWCGPSSRTGLRSLFGAKKA